MHNDKHTLRFLWAVTLDALKSFSGLFKIHTLTLTEVRPENENIKTFVFASNRKVVYQAGQYGVWLLPTFVKGKPGHLFTIASAPSENHLQLSTRISQSDFKQKLNALSVGSKVYMIGPIGQFVLSDEKQAVLLAGGIGITPMRSIALENARRGDNKTNLTLIHSADGNYLYKDEMHRAVGQTHFVTREQFEQTLETVIASVGTEATYFVSGPPAFVVNTEKLLEKHAVRNVKKDGFLGY